MTISSVNTGAHRVSRSATIAAPVGELFEMVADPHRHAELDGSGTVHDTVSGPSRLAKGEKFSVKMKMYGLGYRITSRVTDFDEGRVVEWRHPLGHRWRWEFTPLSPEQTLVTETFDYGAAGSSRTKVYELLGFPKQNAAGIESTLRGLQTRYS
ncbi:YD repeat-containing protein [Jatrophihabitans sp. GAS493]|uniref:SRPBCC family protein n=1 Tax=Jatrophihabitans sp. GAS493 TaxID=1907575 RepID=UPI000BB7D200|nr:SRPBCC family protein [Jatrophihabitans sp. GAS493]SOD70909.1 YD repeat-containing protein [Jatrophihabitans sp. GAS493]